MNYNQYPAIGVDEKLLILQNILDRFMNWDNVNFYGRVTRVLSSDGKAMTPEFYNSATEGMDVYYDDQKAPGGNVFFIDSEVHTGKSGRYTEAKIKVVFMLNLKNLNPNAQYRTDSEIQEAALSLVKRSGVLKDVGIEKVVKNILAGFDADKVKELDGQPYHTFSVNGTLRY